MLLAATAAGVTGALVLVPRELAVSPYLGVTVLGFWIVAASRVGVAVARWMDPRSEGSAALLRSVLWGYAWVVLCIVAAGALGRISILTVHIASTVGFLVAGRSSVPGLRRPELSELLALGRAHPLATLFVLCAVLLTSVNLAWAGLCPPLHNDDLSYHLSFPVEWAQTGSLSWKYIPFGNNSPPYYPKNTELYYLWLYLPMRGLALLSLGQLPVMVALSLAVFVYLRGVGGTVSSASIGASLALLTGPVLRFVSSAYVDLGFAALFVVLIWLLLRWSTSPSRTRWLELSLGAGLFFGTKVLSVAMGTLVVLPCALWLAWSARRELVVGREGWRRALATGLVGLALFVATGGWWYLRNWWETGNPLFPLIVEVGGFEVFDGAYDRSSIPRGKPLSLLTVFVPAWGAADFWHRAAPLAPLLFGLVVTARNALLEASARRLLFVGAVVPVLIGLVFSSIVPYGYPRFVFSVVLFSTALLVAPLQGTPLERRVTGGLLLLSLGVTMTSADQFRALFLPFAHPALHFSLPVGAGLGLGVFALIGGGALAFLGLTKRQIVGLSWTVASVGALYLGALCETSDPGGPHVVAEVRRAWAPGAFLSERYGSARVAFAGSTDSLTLYGWQQSHRVRYHHIDLADDSRFHDRVRAFKPWRTELRGDLLGHGYYRARPLFPAWRANLERWGADVLVCRQLPAWVLRKRLFVKTPDGYPLEARWAAAHPETFREVYDDGEVRIFELVARDEAPRPQVGGSSRSVRSGVAAK